MSSESQEKRENVCKKMYLGEFPGGSVVRFCNFTAEDLGSITSQETKIS